MICSICHQDFDTSGCDDKGFKEIKIQKNSSDGKYYCMKCAIKIYNKEQKEMRGFNNGRIKSITKASYKQIQKELDGIINYCNNNIKDERLKDNLCVDLKRVKKNLTQAVMEEKELSISEADRIVEKQEDYCDGSELSYFPKKFGFM